MSGCNSKPDKYHQLDRRGNKEIQASQGIKKISRGEDKSTVTWDIFKDSIS